VSRYQDPATGAARPLIRIAAVGVAWLMLESIGARIIAFASQIALAWLLLPEDFGAFGLALTVTSLALALANFGVEDVLTQRQRTIRFWVTPAFWISLGLGTLGMLAVLAAAPVAAAVYGVPELVGMLAIMAVAIPIAALAAVPMAMLRAALRFRLLAGYATAELAATQFLAVLLAWQGIGAFSFAVPLLVMAVVRALVFWSIAAPQLRWGALRWSQLRYMIGSGMAVFGTRLIIAAVGQYGFFVLGLTAAPAVIGAYYFASRLAVQPITMMAGSLSRVLFPMLSQLRTDPVRQCRSALEASRALAFVAIPLCFLQTALAEPVLHLVFGPKWEAAIPLVQILSLGLGFDAVSWVVGSLMSAQGEFRRNLVYACLSAPPFFAAATLGALLGSSLGMAIGISAFYVVLPPIYTYAVFRQCSVPLGCVVGLYLVPALLSAVAVGAAYALSLLPPWRGDDAARIVVMVLSGCLLYTVLARCFAPATFMELLGRLGVILRLR
jgi:O-antigen/teichoic acid export membrane protein